jgi:hypothetical protein
MTDREEVRERLAELEQEVAALRRRLESAPFPREGDAGEAGPAPGPGPAADGTAGDGRGAGEGQAAGVQPRAGGADEHAR